MEQVVIRFLGSQVDWFGETVFEAGRLRGSPIGCRILRSVGLRACRGLTDI